MIYWKLEVGSLCILEYHHESKAYIVFSDFLLGSTYISLLLCSSLKNGCEDLCKTMVCFMTCMLEVVVLGLNFCRFHPMMFSQKNFHCALHLKHFNNATIQSLYNTNKYSQKNFHGILENCKNVKVKPSESLPVYSMH